MTSETWVIFHWCKGVKVVQTHSYSGTSILTVGYVACCIHPWVNGVIPHLLPDEWMLEQNKRGKTPEDECRPILQKEEAGKTLRKQFSFRGSFWHASVRVASHCQRKNMDSHVLFFFIQLLPKLFQVARFFSLGVVLSRHECMKGHFEKRICKSEQKRIKFEEPKAQIFKCLPSLHFPQCNTSVPSWRTYQEVQTVCSGEEYFHLMSSSPSPPLLRHGPCPLLHFPDRHCYSHN